MLTQGSATKVKCVASILDGPLSENDVIKILKSKGVVIDAVVLGSMFVDVANPGLFRR